LGLAAALATAPLPLPWRCTSACRRLLRNTVDAGECRKERERSRNRQCAPGAR
jgi:hypothetical protein